MFNKKLFKILSLSLSLSIASMGFAFAETQPAKAPSEEVSIKLMAPNEAMNVKQAEIDKLLFEDNAKVLEEKGISIIYTVAVDDIIEVGITPYTPENADYVSKLIGKENVDISEGVMAVTLEYNPELNEEDVDPRVVMDPAELADDSQIVTTTDAPADPVAEELADDSKVVSVTDKEDKKEKEDKGISPIIIGVGAVAVIGVGATLLKKKRA